MGVEEFVKGEPAGFFQIPNEEIEWDVLIMDGDAEELFEFFLASNHILKLLNQESKSPHLLPTLNTFKELDRTTSYDKPSIIFNECVPEDVFFIEHIDFYRPIILRQLRTNEIARYDFSTRIKNSPFSAEPIILNYALKSYVQENIPEVKNYLKELFTKIDLIAKDLLSGKLNADVLYKFSKSDFPTEIYQLSLEVIHPIFEVCKTYNIKKYHKVYEMVEEQNIPLTFEVDDDYDESPF
jgi:hypothetical protein